VVVSSSSAVASSSSSKPSSSSSVVVSSSSSVVSSSSLKASSSSSVPSSSSSVTYTLACASITATGTAGTAITAPAVTCNGTTVSSGLSWTGAPNWSNPAAGTYSGVSVAASSGNCSGKTATCSGTLTVAAPVTYTLACASVPATGTAGTAITAPAVTCNGSNSTSTTVSSGLSWTSAPNWSSPVAGTYSGVSVSASSGNCSGETATCGGTLIIQGVVYGSPVTYEGETYQTVVIGTQTWFQRNLNYAVEGSKCYDNSGANCTKYGRLYDWATAMALSSDCNNVSCAFQVTAKHRGICPSGWHIPSDAEWDMLINFVGGSSIAGRYLKATSGWDNGNNGEDKYGFSALPGGYCHSSGSFSIVGSNGNWWSASEGLSYYAYYRGMYYIYEVKDFGNGTKGNLFSVRCVKD